MILRMPGMASGKEWILTSTLQLFIDHVWVPALLDRLSVERDPVVSMPQAIRGEAQQNAEASANGLDIGKVPEAA
jgi:hypothetical protein